MSPLPLAKSDFDVKKREWKINAELKFARTIIPKLTYMHHIRAQTPEECELLATINVRSFVYMCMADVPEYVEVDHSKFTGALLRIPMPDDVPYPVQMETNLVIEFYSR